jgi:hypothetical protein
MATQIQAYPHSIGFLYKEAPDDKSRDLPKPIPINPNRISNFIQSNNQPINPLASFQQQNISSYNSINGNVYKSPVNLQNRLISHSGYTGQQQLLIGNLFN